jgi:hypothetical protein
MMATSAKAPILAWLLTAATFFLAGMALTEGRHRTVMLPAPPPAELVITVEIVVAPTSTPEPTSLPTVRPMPAVPSPAPDWAQGFPAFEDGAARVPAPTPGFGGMDNSPQAS